MAADLQALKRRLDALSPADKLLLASQLLTAGQDEIAIVIAESVVLEWQAAKLLRRI
jgi:hypothetical protein